MCLGSYSLPYFKGPTKSSVYSCATSIFYLSSLPCNFYLVLYFIFSQYSRVQSAGDGEQVLYCFVLVVYVQIVIELVGGEVGEVREEISDVLVCSMKFFSEDIYFSPVTSGKQNCFADVSSGLDAE